MKDGYHILHFGQVSSAYVEGLQKSLELEGCRNTLFSTATFVDDTVGSKVFKLFKIFKPIYIALRYLFVAPKSDTVAVHIISPLYALFIPLFRLKTRRIAGFFYGSDFVYRKSKFEFFYRAIFRNFDYLNFPNQRCREEFHRGYPWVDRDRTGSLKFGLDALPEIDRLLADGIGRQNAKRLAGYCENRISVMIGVNASANHRQLEILQKIIDDGFVRERCQLIVLAQYGDAGLVKGLHHFAQSYDQERLYIETSYMNGGEIARIRLASDILIMCPIHDTFSGTVIETLYAGGTVIAGQWLGYDEMPDYGTAVKAVSRLENIPAAVTDALQTDETLKLRNGLEERRQAIRNISSWSHSIQDWKRALI